MLRALFVLSSFQAHLFSNFPFNLSSQRSGEQAADRRPTRASHDPRVPGPPVVCGARVHVVQPLFLSFFPSSFVFLLSFFSFLILILILFIYYLKLWYSAKTKLCHSPFHSHFLAQLLQSLILLQLPSLSFSSQLTQYRWWPPSSTCHMPCHTSHARSREPAALLVLGKKDRK